MHDVMVVAAEQDPVVQGGTAALREAEDVVAVAPFRWAVAGREGPAAVAQDQGPGGGRR